MSEMPRLTAEQAHRRMYLRLCRNGLIGLGIILVSLGIGTAGYHNLLHLSWIDAFMNATMILTTMGPVDRPETFDGKLFTSLYALYSGVVFVTLSTLMVSPVAARFLHRLHVGQ